MSADSNKRPASTLTFHNNSIVGAYHGNMQKVTISSSVLVYGSICKPLCVKCFDRLVIGTNSLWVFLADKALRAACCQQTENSPSMLEPVTAKSPGTASSAKCWLPAVRQCRMGINMQYPPIRSVQLVYKSAFLSGWVHHWLYLIVLDSVMLVTSQAFLSCFPLVKAY